MTETRPPDQIDDVASIDSTAEVVSGTRWGSLSQVVLQVTRLATQIVLARLLMPADFGLVTLGFTFVMFLDLFKDLGTVASLIQKPIVTERLVSTLFWINVAVGALCAATFAAVAPLLAASLDDPRAVGVFRLLGLSLAISSFGLVHQAMIRRARRFGRMAGITMGQAVVVAVVSIVLAVGGANVWALAYGQIAGSVAGVLLAWQGSGLVIRRQFSLAELRTVWGFGLSLTAFNIFNFLFLNADKLLIGGALGATALGLYGLGQRVLFYPVRSVTTMLQQVLFPTFARLDDAAIGRGYLRACAGIALVTFPLMAGLTVVAGPFVRTVFGQDWQDAVFVVAVLAPVGLLHSLHFTVGALYNAKGKGKELLLWGVLSGLPTIAAYIVGLPWGINGVAVAYAIVVVLITYPTFAIPFRFIGLRVSDLWRAVRGISLITAAMVAVTLLVRASLELAGAGDLEVLVVTVGAGTLTYGGLIVVVRPPAFAELRRVLTRDG